MPPRRSATAPRSPSMPATADAKTCAARCNCEDCRISSSAARGADPRATRQTQSFPHVLDLLARDVVELNGPHQVIHRGAESLILSGLEKGGFRRLALFAAQKTHTLAGDSRHQPPGVRRVAAGAGQRPSARRTGRRDRAGKLPPRPPHRLPGYSPIRAEPRRPGRQSRRWWRPDARSRSASGYRECERRHPCVKIGERLP